MAFSSRVLFLVLALALVLGGVRGEEGCVQGGPVDIQGAQYEGSVSAAATLKWGHSASVVVPGLYQSGNSPTTRQRPPCCSPWRREGGQ